jgi:prepilin-type N-terminal cleavage/methylation domain-containing protein
MSKQFSKKYSGFTLIEAMIAIAIVTIGMAGFSLLFMYTWNANKYTLDMGRASMQVSGGLNKMVDYIRGAKQGDDGSFPIKTADDNEMTIFSDYDKDGNTERLHFYKNGRDILMGVTLPTQTLPKTYPSGDQQTITIASNIINDDVSTPVFYYFNKNYPADLSHNPLPTPAQPADIRLSKIFLDMNIGSDQSGKNIGMQSFVELRNLNDYSLSN